MIFVVFCTIFRFKKETYEYEELIDFTQKILEANYLPVYRFELPCEDLDHLDQDCSAIFWA